MKMYRDESSPFSKFFPDDDNLELYPEREIDAEGSDSESSSSESECGDMSNVDEKIIGRRLTEAEVTRPDPGVEAEAKRHQEQTLAEKLVAAAGYSTRNVKIVHSTGAEKVIPPPQQTSPGQFSTEADSSDSESDNELTSIVDDHQAMLLYKQHLLQQRKACSTAEADALCADLNKLELSEEELAYFGEWKREHGAKKDAVFKKFQKFCSDKPECIMRFVSVEYGSSEDTDSGSGKGERIEPLWFHSEGRLKDEDVPNCKDCGARRDFEFQLMPSLIAVQNTHHDFGTAAFYSCSANCGGTTYHEEFCYVQADPDGAAIPEARDN